jgi:Skp family chaperone for outer membrane proteins
MVRRFSLAAGTVAALAVAFVSGAAVSPTAATPVDEKKPDATKPDAKPGIALGHKTAVFNMAAIMRDFNQAKYRVWLLNNTKTEMSKQIIAWRTEYVQLQQEVQKNPGQPDKEKAQKMIGLARKIEDEDRKINQELNENASAIIAELHDMIKAAVTKTAERDGFQLVLAYPDAVTAEEAKSPFVKELKLKPPAAQPFFVAPEIDITARVIKALNEKHPPIDPKTKQPVDVSKLAPVPAPAPVPGGIVPAGGAPRP